MNSFEHNPKLITDEMSEQIIQTAEKIVTSIGANKLTVRQILKDLNITNRVFYNRFHNISEVLAHVYSRTIMKIRKSINQEYTIDRDFFEYVLDIVTESLILSYDIKMKFNQYVFEYDSISNSNYEWYRNRITRLFEYAKEHNLIKDVDSETLSYSIWCFCRGFNADAVMRMPKEEAISKFQYSFRILLNGLKK